MRLSPTNKKPQLYLAGSTNEIERTSKQVDDSLDNEAETSRTTLANPMSEQRDSKYRVSDELSVPFSTE